MKPWHALILVLLVLVGTETLVGRKGDTSALEQAETRIADRAASGRPSTPVIKTTKPQAKTANLNTWFSPDGGADAETVDDFAENTATGGGNQDGTENFRRSQGELGVMTDFYQPSSKGLSSAGSAVPSPQPRLIERST